MRRKKQYVSFLKSATIVYIAMTRITVRYTTSKIWILVSYTTFFFLGYKPNVNCGINKLAELNIASRSEVVRAVANFFLETDPFKNSCYHR